MAELGFTQLEQLWRQAGGSAQLAPIMAAIALAESGGNSEALNDDPSTGDYSVGLWQINYYGDLYTARAARWGPPDALRLGPQAPLKNAVAAVSLARGGAGLGNWSTYNDGAYDAHLPAGTTLPPAPASSGGRTRPNVAPGAGSKAPSMLDGLLNDNPLSLAGAFWNDFTGIGSVVDFLKVAAWLVHPQTWLRALEFAVGAVMMLFGFVGLGVVLVARTETAQSVSSTASVLPGPLGLAARGLAIAGGPKRAARSETRRAVTARTTPTPYARRQSAIARAREQGHTRALAREARTDAFSQRLRQREQERRGEDPSRGEVPF